MSQWGRGEEAHAAMVLAIHLVNGGRTQILEGEAHHATKKKSGRISLGTPSPNGPSATGPPVLGLDKWGWARYVPLPWGYH